MAEIDYNDEASIVTALKDQQFFVITLSPTAPRDTHSKLVQAAAKAGVPYVLPNYYGGDILNVTFGEDTMLGPIAKSQRMEIEELGMSWITVCCSFWYDYSLAGGEARFGFDFDKKTFTVYDDGNTRISASTLKQVGLAIAKILSLKELPENEGDGSLTLSSFVSNGIYVKSFAITQNEMFESVKRVTGTTDADWTITHENTQQRYQDGLAQIRSGNRVGFSKMLYARGFFPSECNDLSDKAQNKLLGLPEESLDEATNDAVNLVKVLAQRVERMAA